MEPEYKLEGEMYAFYLDGSCRFRTDEVAILFDKGHSVLLKHGPPPLVEEAFKRMTLACANAPHGAVLADDLVVIRGKFSLDDLNKTISICDYIGRLYQKLEAQALEAAQAVCKAAAAH